jgi:hypothetical protein
MKSIIVIIFYFLSILTEVLGQNKNPTLMVQKEKELMQYAREDAARSYELSKIQTEAYRQVSVEWARNQPKTVNYTSNYNRIIWW